MIYPISGARLPREGSKLDYLYQRSRTHKHRGLDFPAPLGTRVIASEPGVVVKVVNKYTPGFRGYGKVVVIQGPSGKYFLYAHLNKTLVSFGDYVELGQPIGHVGKTQYSKANPAGDMKSGPHLHFEISATPYPQHAEASRLNPRIGLTQGRFTDVPAIEPSIPPKIRIKKPPVKSSDGKILAVGVGILALIWLLLQMKR